MSMKPYTFINRLLQLDREIKEKNLNVYSREFLEDEECNQFIQIVCEGNYMRCSVEFYEKMLSHPKLVKEVDNYEG